MRSFVSVPLRADERTPGVLFFVADRPFVWTEEHVRLCTMAGEQAAVAVRGVGLLKAAHEAEDKHRARATISMPSSWKAMSSPCSRPSSRSKRWRGWVIPPQKWLEDPQFWLEVICPQDRDRVKAEVKAKIHSPHPWQVEFCALSASGREIWLRCLMTPEVHDGEVVKTRALALDVTELKHHLAAILNRTRFWLPPSRPLPMASV